MHTFAIAWVSLFDNELHMKITHKESEQAALERAYLHLVGVAYCPTRDGEDIKQAAFDRDGMIEAIEIEGSCFGG